MTVGVVSGRTGMHVAYVDESGDDGFPAYSSPLFVLSTIYLHYLQWKSSFERLHALRRELRRDFGFPVNVELHTKQFLLGKNPYRSLGLTPAVRVEIVERFCDLIGALDCRIVNAVIVKPRITVRDYDVLDWAVKVAIQRLENDLKPATRTESRFLLITDPGRVGKMRTTTRRLQRFNYIPSKFGPAPYRAEIQSMIEDPMPKDSKESFFVQAADLVAYVVYLYGLTVTGAGKFSNRMPAEVTAARVDSWLQRLKPSLNLEAAKADPYGVKFLPG